MRIVRLAKAPFAVGLVVALGSCHGSPGLTPGAVTSGSAASPATRTGSARGPVGALAMEDGAAAAAEPYVSLTTSDGAGLALAEMTAHAVIDDPLSFTELHLAFDNPEDRTLEGRFHIVLPPGAAISRLAMRIDGAWQEGEIVEKQSAREAYEDALHRKQDPALLEQSAANELTARVFPIRARARKEIIVSYSQEMKESAPYTLPLRGLPAIGVLHADATRVGDTTPLQSLDLASAAPPADFVLGERFTRAGDGVRSGGMVIARARPVASAEPDPVARAIVLFDTSASRALGIGDQARELADLAHRMDGSHLTVACFDQEVEQVFDGDAAAFGDADVRRILERGPLGASDLTRALAWAKDAAKTSHATRVIVISDGVATAGATDADAIVQRARELRGAGIERIDAVVVGGIRDEAALHRLVTAGLVRDGVVVDGAHGAAEVARRVRETTRSNVAVRVPGATWVYPSRIDGAQSGDETLVYAELPEGAPAKLQLGSAPPRDLDLRAAEKPLVERALAAAKIAKLTDAEARGGANAKTHQEIVELSVGHRVLSPYTAMVVLETEQDYARFGIGRRGLADVLAVDAGRIVRRKRALPRLEPKPLANDPMQARGNMWGDGIGDSFGAGGLGLSGVGEGGGGRGEGIGLGNAMESAAGSPRSASPPRGAAMSPPAKRPAPRPTGEGSAGMIGLGSIGTIGHGAGTGTGSGGTGGGGSSADFNRAASGHATSSTPPAAAPAPVAAAAGDPLAPSAPWGREDSPSPAATGRSRSRELQVRGPTPSVRMGATQVNGRLPPEVIQRIVRQNFGRFRQCYQNGLQRNPALAGRVAVRFVIGSDGAVTRAEDGGSAMADSGVVRCVVNAFTGLSFPQPEGGIVTVTYPIVFAPDGDSAASAERQPVANQWPQRANDTPRSDDTASPYTGPFKEVMDALERGATEDGLARAARWHRESPGDVLALVALGEALEHGDDARNAARAYGSIVDLFPGRADMRRFAGERLERLDQKAGARASDLVIDTYEKAKADRPDHPSSHRLLAFARLRHGDNEAAFEAMLTGMRQPYPAGRFRGVDRILREDLGLIAAAWSKREPKRAAEIEQRTTAAGAYVERGPSLRFVLDWETDANDVDFHVFDAVGGHAFYSQPALPSGGELYADVTTGYGPECFAIRTPKRARKGPYVLQAHYYSKGPMGYGMGKLEIIDHDGAGNLTFEERPYVVMTDQAFVDLGEYPGK